MTSTGTLNFHWAQSLIAGFAAAGVSHAVISPGSRSSPLALALLRCPEMRCHVVVDERSAAFFALGLAKATGMPPLVLCTSGSAVANWFPAVMEADRGQVPLLLFSTDRPPELQGWGANQTVDQVKVFGAAVRAAHALGLPDPAVSPDYLYRLAARAVSESRWPRPGPVHLNQPLREPLLPDPGDQAMASPARPRPSAPLATPLPCSLPPDDALAHAAARLSGRPGVILCGGGDAQTFGPDFAGAVTALAQALDCPILADPLSNLRFGPHDRSRVLVHGEAFLRSPHFSEAHPPAWVLRFGAPPVSRSLLTWLGKAGQELLLIDAYDAWPDPQHRAGILL
ncbi:MAG: 2-succinyl-5-enolpyruvyl-6-hydroxy-3-cyclohexene-1-carboxylic-acid synthase, partial [Betaproteobacteria bacterium]|nr:2-succinyl-5-enolpyruvyl-6-hydroxy-3-cyclohexene-1-carboxylic-acid synthase [Betaproteobacteria bacterium]